MKVAYNGPEMSRIAPTIKSDNKCTNNTKNGSKENVLTITSVTKIDTVTN